MRGHSSQFPYFVLQRGEKAIRSFPQARKLLKHGQEPNVVVHTLYRLRDVEIHIVGHTL